MDDLLHFSSKPLGKIRSTRQVPEPDYKPLGLWLSVGAGWPDWCLAEQFRVGSLRHITRVELEPNAHILTLADGADLDAFTAQYGVDVLGRAVSVKYRPIAWNLVAADFDGIIIAPYVSSRRFSIGWYYGWDVASGCVWKANAIARTESLGLASAVSASLAGEQP